MRELIGKLFKNDKIRYLFIGGCTTLVNMISFFLLRLLTNVNRNTCNIIAIVLAIIFAYFTNKYFVFKSKKLGVYGTIAEVISFIGGRIVSMIVEVLGFAILCDSLRLNELFAKILVQFVVIALNYVISKFFVFNKERRSIKEAFADNYCYYIPFIIIVISLTIIMIVEKIAPFGPHSLTIIDSIHQYVPFYSEFRDKLLHEGSLFYSWNIALGSNFISLAAYYLSSPFNLIFLIVGKEQIIAVACIIMVVKIGLCAVSMVHFLSYKNGEKERNLKIIAVSLCYAFSNYIVGYSWNSMWLDCLIALPLIILGFQRMLEKKDSRLYIASLFYALYCNYYIGYIICLFLVIWFITYNHKSVKGFFMDGIKFAISSLIAGGLSAFLLIPAYFGIMTTAAGKMKLPKSSWYGNIFVLIKQQFFMTDPLTNQNFDGGVNLFCGTLAVMSLFLYLISAKTKTFDKIRYVIMLALLMVSFNNVLPNYIWHGMHDQYGIPNRFSFLYIFIMLIMAYEVLEKIKSFNPPLIVAGTLFTLALVIYTNTQSKLSTQVLVGTCIMVAVYTIVLSIGSIKKVNERVFSIIVSSVCVLEMLISGIGGFLENGYSDANKYYSTSKKVTKAHERLVELAEEDGMDFYRAELVDSTVLDEATWHNLPSVGTFCSTVNGNAVTAMGKLGFYTGANEFLYMGSTPFTNTLLNVRYLLGRETDYYNFAFDYVETVDSVDIYKNPYPLSIGFGASRNIKEHTMAGNSFVIQNALSNVMMYSPSFFELKETSMIVTNEGCSETRISNNSIYYSPEKKGDVRLYVSFYVNDPGDYYVECRGNSINKIRFSVDDQELTYDRYQLQVFHLGELQKDQYVTVEYYLKDVSEGEKNVSLNIATFDQKCYEEFYDKARLSMLNVEDFKDGYIKGDINLGDEQTMLTTIPYDEGWKILVDGEETEYYKALLGFIGVDMESGTHTVEMIYTPKGLKAGILISILSLLSCMTLIILEIKAKNRQKIDNNELTEE